MKKKILSFAIALFGVAAVASAQCPAGAAADGNKMYQPSQFTDFAFEGILLDIDQQNAINALNEEMLPACPASKCEKAEGECCKAEGKCDKAEGKCDKAEGKCDKAEGKCDKAKCDKKDKCKKAEGKCRKGEGRRPHMSGGHAGMGPRPTVCKEYVEKVKEILTPEQYVTFLENIVFMPAQPMGAPMHSGRMPAPGPCPR